MTNEELAEIRAYVAERAAARARGEHIDSDERREAALLDELEEVMGDLYQLADRAERVWREMGYHTAAISQSGRSSLDALRAALDATPEETRAAVGARERALADRDVMKRELDEAREEAAQWKRLAEQTTDARLAEAIASREVMQRERDEARRELLDLDLVLPAACGSRVDAARQLEAERDDSRAQLAALHALAAASADAFEDISVSRAECEARNAALRAATFDLSTAAAEHERRVRAPVEAERDRLAAALAEVRDAASESIRESFWVGNDAPARAARERVIAVLAALPTDLAAQREARIRADERARGLEDAAYLTANVSDAEVFRAQAARLRGADVESPVRRPLDGVPTPPLGERTSVIARVEDHDHHLVVAMYRFHDGTERPYVEVHESHDRAGPARVLPLPEAVHLMQNVSLDELHSIGGREVGVRYDADSTPETARERCSGCGHEIDANCCWCGNEREAHGHNLSGHEFRPMGCLCGFADEAERGGA